MSRKNIVALFVMLGLGISIFWWEARKIDFRSLVTTFKSLNYGWLAWHSYQFFCLMQ